MAPKKKTTEFPPVRVTEKLKEETERAAEKEDVYVSEYIRLAVEERNKKVLGE